MVRRFKVPNGLKRHFTNNELSGWADGISYTPAEMKDLKAVQAEKRRTNRDKQRKEPTLITPPVFIPVEGLIGLGSDSILL